MSVNVLGQNVTTTWSRLKHPDLHMLSLSHAHLEAYRAAVNGVSEQSLLPPLSYHHHPSSSTLGLPFDHAHPSHLARGNYGPGVATGGLSPWNVLNLDRTRKLASVTGHTKVPVSIVSSNEKTRSTSNDESSTLTHPYLGKNGDENEAGISGVKGKSGSSKRGENKNSRENQSSSRKDYAKCQLSKSQMNGLPDKINMTGSGGPTNADHLNWLADVTTGSRGSAPQRPSPREPSSPGGGHHQTGASSNVGGLAHPADNVIGSGSSSLFRPPIPSAPSTNDLYPAQFALPGPSSHLHHRGSMAGADSNMAAYYNHVTPHHFSPFYSPRYSPTGPYAPLSAQSSPGLVPQQFFPVDSFSGSLQQSAIEGARVSGGHHPSQASTLQLPHSRSFAHHHNSLISSQSSYPGGGLGKANLSGGGSVMYDERHSSIKDKVPSSMIPKPDKKNHLLNPLTMKLSGKPLDMNSNNGLEQSRHEFSGGGIKSSLKTGGIKDSSLKHRILRPGNITITEPPSSVLGDAPLSAPPLRTTYQSDIPSNKYPRLSTPNAFTHSRQRSPLPPIIKLPKENSGPPVPNFVPTSIESRASFGTTHFQFPAYFKKGSIIQLANSSLRRVEDLTTEDFLQSASLSPDLSIDSSTVVKVEESADRKSAILGFSVGQSQVQVSVETPLEHPFFVFSRGWSSCSPERSLQQYGLTCQKLKIGDVCVSLTHKNLKKGSNRQGSPAATSVSITVTEPTKSVVDKEVLDSSNVRPKSSSTMPKEELLVTTSSPNSEEDKDKCVVGSRKRRSSAPANLNLDQMPSNKT